MSHRLLVVVVLCDGLFGSARFAGSLKRKRSSLIGSQKYTYRGYTCITVSDSNGKGGAGWSCLSTSFVCFYTK
ncbi:Uncharacterized protein APZ42_023698 [Daphnia magna]|uniref:Secreted protein n=1 Tax=Daphnia magna TaxID=35525 RepID=A0A164UP46_9CRUS|nr:Uncharacterized protein APZ42_023698 [Daphnia magna]